MSGMRPRFAQMAAGSSSVRDAEAKNPRGDDGEPFAGAAADQLVQGIAFGDFGQEGLEARRKRARNWVGALDPDHPIQWRRLCEEQRLELVEHFRELGFAEDVHALAAALLAGRFDQCFERCESLGGLQFSARLDEVPIDQRFHIDGWRLCELGADTIEARDQQLLCARYHQ
jgi:hypothetical protein